MLKLYTRIGAGSISDDSLLMHNYVFAYHRESMKMNVVSYIEQKRSNLFKPWHITYSWEWSIVNSTCPVEVPEWAIRDAKNKISNKIQFVE